MSASRQREAVRPRRERGDTRRSLYLPKQMQVGAVDRHSVLALAQSDFG